MNKLLFYLLTNSIRMSLPVNTREISFSNIRKLIHRQPDTYLLDKFSNFTKDQSRGAYSLNYLTSSYVGPVVLVRRETDNVEKDFYPDDNGALYTGKWGYGQSLESWLGNSNGFVKTWYDQSGKGRDLVQPTYSFQPRISSLAEYPPSDLTSNTTSISDSLYANGTYIASSSSVYPSTSAWNAFDSPNNLWWESAVRYNLSTGVYTGSVTTSVGATTYSGEWLQLELPEAISLKQFFIQNGSTKRSPRNFVLLGKDSANSSAAWTLLFEGTNVQSWSANKTTAKYFSVSNTNKFSVFRLVIMRVGNYDTNPSINIDPDPTGLEVCSIFKLGFMSSTNPYVSYNENIIKQQYPPVLLTGYTTSITNQYIGNGNYIVTASSEYTGEESWKAFGTFVWTSLTSIYNGTGDYTGSQVTLVDNEIDTSLPKNSISGEWLQIQLPTSICLSYYSIAGRLNGLSRSPKDFYLVGSNNGTSWKLLDSRRGINNWSTNDSVFYNFTQESYSYYRLIISRINNTSGSVDNCNIRNFKLFYETPIHQQYPPSNLTSASTTLTGQTYGNGTYTISASSEYTQTSELAWNAFSTAQNVWTSSTQVYNNSGNYIGSTQMTIAGEVYTGEWLQIQLPYSVKLTNYNIVGWANNNDRSPRRFWLTGSNDGSNWTIIDDRQNVTSWTNSGINFHVSDNPQKAYSYYRLIINQINRSQSGSQYCSISQFELFYGQYQYVKLNSESYSSLAMTSQKQLLYGSGFGNGFYTATASSTLSGFPAYSVFDNNRPSALTSFWHSEGGVYNNSTGAYIGNKSTNVIISDVSTNIPGEWLQIQIPKAFPMTVFSITPRVDNTLESPTKRSPRSFMVVGSHDGNTWNLVHQETNINNWDNNTKSFSTSSTTPYTHFRLIIRRVGNFDSSTNMESVQISNWWFFEASASNTYSWTQNDAYFGFYSDTTDSKFWHSISTYNTTTGEYTGTVQTSDINNTVYFGEWLQIRLPYAIPLNMFQILPRAGFEFRAPKRFYILASNNGSTWVNIYQETSVNNWTKDKYFTCAQKTAYSYYRLVVNSVGNSGVTTGMDSVNIGWKLYGSSTPLIINQERYSLISQWSSNNTNKSSIVLENWSPGVENNKKASIFKNNDRFGFSGQNNDCVLTTYAKNTIQRTVLNNDTTNGVNINLYNNGIFYQGNTTATLPSLLDVAADTFTIGKSASNILYHEGRINEVIVFGDLLQSSEALTYTSGQLSSIKQTLPDPNPDFWLDFNPRDSAPITNNHLSNNHAALDLSYFINKAHTSTVDNWNGYTQTTVSNRPIYYSTGGYLNSQGYINFIRTNSQHLTGGTKTLNVDTNGGFTAVAFIRFTGTAGHWERIFDFSTGDQNNPDSIFLSRETTSTTLACEIRNGSTIIGSIRATNAIVQNEWAVFGFRYRKSDRRIELIKNGIVLSSVTASADVTNKTLSATYIGRSLWTQADAYLNADMAGLYIYDKYLTDSEMSSMTSLLMYPTTLPVVKPFPIYPQAKSTGYILYQPYKSTYSARFNGDINTCITVKEVPSLPFTFCFWYNSSSSSNQTIIGLTRPVRNLPGLAFDIINSSTIRIYAALPTFWSNTYDLPFVINTWYHVALVLNSKNEILVYHNGTYHGMMTGNSMMLGKNVLTIGAAGDRARGYNGLISDFRIYERVLRADEITQVYNNQWTVLKPNPKVNRQLMSSTTWHNLMGFSGSTVLSGSGSNTQNQLTTQSNIGQSSSIFQQLDITNFESFDLSFEFKYSTVGANLNNFLQFFCGSTIWPFVSRPIPPSSMNTAYSIVFSQTNPNIPKGVVLYDNNSTVIYNVMGATTTDSYEILSPNTKWVGNNDWNSVSISYKKGTVDTWRVTLNGEDVLRYSDPNNTSWVGTNNLGTVIQDGLIAYFDPANRLSYKENSNTINSLVGDSKGTLFGEYSYVGGYIKLNNSHGSNLLNISGLQISSLSNIRTISIWYYQHPIPAAPTRYLMDIREGLINGYLLNVEIGSGFSGTTFYVNGGAATPLTWSNIEATGSWRNLTFVLANNVSDNINFFSRFSNNEGLNVTIGPIFIYNRVLSQEENLINYNNINQRFAKYWGIGVHTANGEISPDSFIRRVEISYQTLDLALSTIQNSGYSGASSVVSVGNLLSNKMGLMDGLICKSYNIAFNGNVHYFSDNHYMAINRTIVTKNIATTSGVFGNTNVYVGQTSSALNDNFSFELFGYFRANISGTWEFKFDAYIDDIAYCWIGSNALYGYSPSNANLSAGGNVNSVTYSVTLTAGQFYPIRIQYGEIVSIEQFSFSFRPPNSYHTYNGQGYFFSPTGLSQEFPAENAKIIKDITKTNEDGVYYINCKGISKATYCLMNDIYNGGGWMMLMKGEKGNTFRYTSNYWTTNNTLNITSTNRTNVNAKFDVFNDIKIKDVLAIYPEILDDTSVTNTWRVGIISNGVTGQLRFWSDLDSGHLDRAQFPDGKLFSRYLQENNYDVLVTIYSSANPTPVPIHIYGLVSLVSGNTDFDNGTYEQMTVYIRNLNGEIISDSPWNGIAVITPIIRTSGSLQIDDGWTWKVDNWGETGPMLNQLSSVGQSNARGIYACYRVARENYNGATIRVRNGTTNIEEDFYADILGNMGTGPDATGTDLATWLNGATAFVTTWYDQSGSGRHATQTTTTNQPTFNISSKLIDFGSSSDRFFTIPSGTVPVGTLNAQYTIAVKHGVTSKNNGALIGAGTTTLNTANVLIVGGSSENIAYKNYWWNNDHNIGTDSQRVSGNAVVVGYNGTSSTAFINGTLISTVTRAGYTVSAGTQYIGRSPFGEYLNGQLYHVYVFGTYLSNSDINLLSNQTNTVTQKVTALNGFQMFRYAQPRNIFEFSGFDGRFWSSQYGTNSAVHIFGGGPPGSNMQTRWGFIFNNEDNEFASCDAGGGIGTNSADRATFNSSAQDFYFAAGRPGLNRLLNFQLFGR